MNIPLKHNRVATKYALMRAVLALSFTLGVASSAQAQAVPATPVSGAEVYGKYCASCHNQVSARIPTRDALEKMSPARILRTLDFGLMMSIAYPIKRGDREAVANYLGKGVDESAPPASAYCKADRPIMSAGPRENWTGWGPEQSNTRFQTAERAGLKASDLGRLELKWAYGFAGDVTAFAAPTILNGTMFVGSAGGAVQALDAKTGCLYWLYQASGPVRAAMTVATEGAQNTLVFSDQTGWVYAWMRAPAKPDGRKKWKNTRLRG